jgi:putative flippase GtrA
MPTASRASRTWQAHRVKLGRYTAVSALFTLASFAALAILVGVINFPAGWANFVIIALSIPPAFELNRRWVWSAGGRTWWSSPEVIPFGAFSLAALGLSTMAAHVAGGVVAHWTPGGRTLAVEAASLGSFGVLWLIEYVVLDRVLFRQSEPAPPEVEAAHG